MTEDFTVEMVEKPSEAEQAFSSTTSKKNLSGVRGRASRTGRKGAVMTPVDFLRGKEKKEYMKNSEVRVYNMYDEKVLSYDEFKSLPVDKQVVLMTRWREDVGTNHIIKEMKISRKKFYSEVLKSLGIETKPRGRRPKQQETEVNQKPASVSVVQEEEILEKEGLMLLLNGKYDGQTLGNRFARLARVFDHEGEYEIKVQIREV